MSLYRFSPIETAEDVSEVIRHIAKQASKLAFRNLGYIPPIEYVTIFAHYDSEYDKLVELMTQFGEQTEANNGIKTILNTPIVIEALKLEVNGKEGIATHTIKAIRIRKPDPYRMQVGCCDFKFDGDYEQPFYPLDRILGSIQEYAVSSAKTLIWLNSMTPISMFWRIS